MKHLVDKWFYRSGIMHRLYKKENGRTFLLQKSSHSLLASDAVCAKFTLTAYRIYYYLLQHDRIY